MGQAGERVVVPVLVLAGDLVAGQSCLRGRLASPGGLRLISLRGNR